MFNHPWDDTMGDLQMIGGGSAALQQTMLRQSPFFHIESFYLPSTTKELFRFSYQTFLTNPVVNSAIEKLSEYPITEFTFSPIIREPEDSKEYKDAYKQRESVIDRWEEIYETHLQAKGFAVGLSMDFYLYGNAFASVYAPFDRVLICGNEDCRENHIMTKVKWEWDSGRLAFKIKCWKCQFKGYARVKDKPVADPTRINLIRFHPGNIDIEFDPYSGSKEYYYNVPDEQAEKIKKGNPLMLEKTPWVVIEAVREHKNNRKEDNPKVKLTRGSIFHLTRHSASSPGVENPWGMPITVSVLREIFYINMMKRAQLALLLEHIIPFRYLYPATDVGSGTTIPMDLADWRSQMESEVARWKRDPLYIMLTPVPVGEGRMGGDGKALMLFAEMEMVETNIINGLNVPQEFLRGGLTYTGSSVSLRMLENTLMNQVEQVIKCFKWITRRISQITKMEYVDCDLRKFKMADDVQAKQLILQLWQMQAVSGEKLGEWFEFDYAQERKKRTQENISQAVADAKAQAQAANEMMVIQALLQNVLAPELLNTMPAVDPNMVDQVFQGLQTIQDPNQQAMAVQQIGAANPDIGRELSARAATDKTTYGKQIQMLLAMSPQDQQSTMEQVARNSPVQGLILATLARNFGIDSVMGLGGGGQAQQPPGGGKVEKNMPEQKPPRRQGGSPT
jgi:hypothetical protein